MGLIDNVNVNVGGNGSVIDTLSTYVTKVLKPNIINGKNILSQYMMPIDTGANTKYVIKYDFELNEDITIPANCILEFDGGSLSNGTLIGNGTVINSCVRCFDTDVVISGTWGNGVIQTKWFSFVSSDDGTTDNLLAFKQVQSMANGGGKVKIEFEPNLYLQSSIPQLVHSNAHRYNGTESILYFDKVDYVEINLNGSTIKLLDNDSVWTNIICVSRTNAVIKNGHLTGNADVDNYPPYVNTDGTIGYTYEWGYGLCLLGGNLTAENLDISYCKGDGINAGSWWIYPEGDLLTSIVGNYNILNCNVSYTGRNGMAFRSSDYGTVRHCNIHHIGSNATVQGRLPKAGIDLEFEDLPHAEGYTPSLDFSNLHISDCDNNTIVTARIVKNDVTLGTPVKSFSLRDSYLKGALQLAQINVGNYYVNDGNVKINNNVIEANANDTTHSSLAVHTYKNCRFIINSFVFPANGRFEDCEFLQPSGSSSIFATEQSIVTAPEFLNCNFIISYLNLTDATITNSNLYFKAATSNTSRRSIYNGTTITGHVDGTKKTRIIFDDNNVEKTIAQLRHCSLKNLGNLDGSTDGVLFYTSATFDDCVFEECEFSISNYNVIINCCSGKNMFLRTQSAEGAGKFIFSSSVCKALTTSSLLRGDGRITLNDSVIELSAGDLTKQYFNLHNSMLTAVDKTKRTIEAFSPTIKALNSILNIGVYVYWSLNMNKSMYKNIQGLWIDDNGGDVGVSLNGTTTSRPEGNQIYIGFSYFDTTLGKPIYAKEIAGAYPYTVTWVDATGATV